MRSIRSVHDAILDKARSEANEPPEGEAVFADSFVRSIREGELNTIDELDDEGLQDFMGQAERAYKGLSKKDEQFSDKVQPVIVAYHTARELLDERQRKRGDDARAQTFRQDKIFCFALEARSLCERFAQVGFRPDIMTPDIQPPLSDDAARATDYKALSTMADQAHWYAFNNANETRQIDAAISGIRLLIDSKALDTALADLETRRAHLIRATSAHNATEAKARAEMQRRQLEAAERAKVEKDLPETIKQLQERIAELEQANAATA